MRFVKVTVPIINQSVCRPNHHSLSSKVQHGSEAWRFSSPCSNVFFSALCLLVCCSSQNDCPEQAATTNALGAQEFVYCTYWRISRCAISTVGAVSIWVWLRPIVPFDTCSSMTLHWPSPWLKWAQKSPLDLHQGGFFYSLYVSD